VTPTMDDDDDDDLPKSHWSGSDSEGSPEMTRMQRVRRALSFARLRPQKPQGFQAQNGNQASKSTTSVGKRMSGSSGSCRTRSNSNNGAN
jgi:hypothetical protein